MARSNWLLWPTPQTQWHALIDCYGQHRRPVARSSWLLWLWPTAQASGTLQLALVSNTAGPWHALIDCYGQHPQAAGLLGRRRRKLCRRGHFTEQRQPSAQLGHRVRPYPPFLVTRIVPLLLTRTLLFGNLYSSIFSISIRNGVGLSWGFRVLFFS